MRRQLSARSRLTLLYTSLFAIGGVALVIIAYVLVLHSSHAATPKTIPRASRELEACLRAAQTREVPSVIGKCGAIYIAGAQTGAAAQRRATADQLLDYSLVALAGVILLATLAGWILAGRILRPVHRLTAAARAASGQNLSGRIALKGPRDELRELADTFDDLLERLEDAFDSQRQFIANASHELRTPLTLMRTAIDVVLAKPAPTRQELVSMAADVRHAVDHSERLLSALLILARNERGLAVHEQIDLAIVAEDALDAADLLDRRVHSTLEPAVVSGDPVLAERLVANLIDNAVRYNTPAGEIWLCTRTAAGSAQLTVANAGPIISPADTDRILQPFERLNDRVSHNGYGLGLAIVASIATIHGGIVSAEPRDGGGLCVTVAIPSTGPVRMTSA